METCKRKGKKYVVKLVGKEILNFHPLAENQQHWVQKIAKWKQVREIVVDCEEPGKVFLKHDFAARNHLEVSINTVGRPVNLANYNFKKAFNRPIALKKKKT